MVGMPVTQVYRLLCFSAMSRIKWLWLPDFVLVHECIFEKFLNLPDSILRLGYDLEDV